MDEEILKKFEDQEKMLDKIYRSAEKTRKYFLYALIVTAVMVVLPLVGLLFAIPKFLDIYANIGI